MKLGLFGGTFDPIHNGHLSMAAACADELALDQVVFIPAGDPYHKSVATRTPAAKRLAMVEAAISGDVRFAASDIDMVREGATYTVDTLQILRQYYPNAEIWWLMGMDSLLSMHTWHRYQDIFKLANVAVAARNDEKIQQVAPEMRALVAQGLSQATSASKGQLRLLQWQPEDISSTQIRNAVKSGLAIDGWVPKPVRDYISTHGLYR